jgi:hypothetical protein
VSNYRIKWPAETRAFAEQNQRTLVAFALDGRGGRCEVFGSLPDLEANYLMLFTIALQRKMSVAQAHDYASQNMTDEAKAELDSPAQPAHTGPAGPA